MIICMSDVICVTNRRLCEDDFLDRLETIAAARPRAVILREKDLPEQEYRELARQALEICGKYRVPCMLHSFVHTAKALHTRAIHLPLPLLRAMTAEERAWFTVLGASCHSVEDALEAEKLGCTYLTAGHIFNTDCKRGLPGRGLGFLRTVCGAVSIPVYAIGGVTAENYSAVRQAGAAGACVMSGLMRCADPAAFMLEWKMRLWQSCASPL